MKNIQSSQEKTARIQNTSNISPNQIQSERQNFDVDMNEFNMLNAHHQESINSSAGMTVLRQVQDNIKLQNSKNNQQPNGSILIKDNRYTDAIRSQEVQLKEEDSSKTRVVASGGGEGFFLTGVNVNGQVIEGQHEDDNVNPLLQESQLQVEAKLDFDEDGLIDNYEVISIIDSSRALSNDNCVIINEKQQSLTHLTCNSQVTLRVDALVSQYSQVEKIAKRYAKIFVDQQKTDKLILNISDQHDTSNIGGFNISNFKMRYLNEFINDIISDYEQSFLGCFSKQLIQHMQSLNFFKSLDLYMSITKFEGDSGFSLVQGDDQEELQDDVVDDYQEFQVPLPNIRQSRPRDGEMSKKQSAKKKNTDKKRISSEKYLIMSSSPKNKRDSSQEYIDDGRVKKQLFSQDKKTKLIQNQPKKTQGSLPEYKQISDMSEIYSAFTQANLRYRVLKRKLQDKSSLDASQIKYQQDEIKDEIILIQFKLINKETEKQLNSFNILNVPLSKMGDINLQNLHDILIKLKSGGNKAKEYIPYNKSIMSRILAPILNKENIVYLSHYSKRGIISHLNSPNHTGLANGLFLFLDKIFMERRFKKKKLNHQEALKILQKKFSKEVKEIYSIIGNFRDGVNSFETYTNQSAQTMQTVNKAATKTQSFTLFHQILHFLALKEDIDMNGGPLANSNFLSEEEIQKVIFDKQYLKYLRKKIRAELAGMPQIQAQQSTVKLTKLQQVQYECIKSELKEDYEKKVTSLKNRLDKKAMRDPSLLLFSQLTQEEPKKTSTTPLAGNGFNKSFTSGGRNASNQYNRPRFQQNANNNKKFQYQLENVNDKDKFYEFYLKSAQKAIDIMRQQQILSSDDKIDSQNQTFTDGVNVQNLPVYHPSKAQNQSEYQSQSSSVIEQSKLNYNQNNNSNSHYIQNLGTGLRINNPLRAQSSKKEERRQPRSIRNIDSALEIENNNHNTAKQQKLQPLFVREHIYHDNSNVLERIEERIKNSKLSETQYTQNAYSNLDRKTSASSQSRAALSSQNRKFRKVLSNNQAIQMKQKSGTDVSSAISQIPKAQTELTKVKEFLPLRAQGKLKAFNIYNEGADSGYQDNPSDMTQFRENPKYLKNQSNLYNLSSLLYEQRDMKRKPQTAQRQKRIPQNQNNYASNDLNRQRTNSMSKPTLIKRESSNMTDIEKEQDPYSQNQKQQLSDDKPLFGQLYQNAS